MVGAEGPRLDLARSRGQYSSRPYLIGRKVVHYPLPDLIGQICFDKILQGQCHLDAPIVCLASGDFCLEVEGEDVLIKIVSERLVYN